MPYGESTDQLSWEEKNIFSLSYCVDMLFSQWLEEVIDCAIDKTQTAKEFFDEKDSLIQNAT